jgi:HK97 family phage portal protein
MEFSINFSLRKKKPVPVLTERDREWITFGRGVGMNTPNEFWNAAFPELNPNNVTKVTKENALTISAVYQAINISANSLNLPITVKKKADDGSITPVGKEDRYEYQCNFLLRVSPNKMNTPAEWISLMETSRLMYGNAYSYISRDGSGMPKALKWLHPDQVEITPDNIQNYYQVYDLQTRKLIYKNVPYWDMIHVKALNGVSVIDYATNSLGLSMATQKTSKKFYEDGMTNKVVLSYPGALKDAGKKNLSESFSDQMKKNSTIVLEEGLKPYMHRNRLKCY